MWDEYEAGREAQEMGTTRRGQGDQQRKRKIHVRKREGQGEGGGDKEGKKKMTGEWRGNTQGHKGER